MHPISIAAEKVYELFDFFPVTNTLLTTWIVMALLILGAFLAGRKIVAGVPKGIQNALEAIFEGFSGLFESVLESKTLAREIFYFVITVFTFILFSNWFGLLPGVGAIGFYEGAAHGERAAIVEHAEPAEETAVPVAHEEKTEAAHSESAEEKGGHKGGFIPLFRAGSSDLSFTLALAICAVLYVQFMGIKHLHLGYFKKFFDLRSPIHFFVGILEIVSECAKMISFSFRLFGNIFAGEVLLAVMTFLAPFIIPIPFYGLEIFVGMVQALVFSMLTLVFLKGAVAHH